MRSWTLPLLAALALAGCGSDKTHGGAEATATPQGGASPAPVVETPY